VLGGDSELKGRCSEFIVPVQPSEMPNIVAHIGKTLSQHSPERITRVRDELVYNFGNAGQVAAEQLAQILHRERSKAKLATASKRVWRLPGFGTARAASAPGTPPDA
jgi:hypothetical protein